MAEAELTIQYKSTPAALTNAACWIFWPISMFVWIWSCVALGMRMETLSSGPVVIFLGANAVVVTIIGLLLFLSSDKTIFISRDGLSLPFFVSPCFGMRAKKKWTDLVSIDFDSTNGGIIKLLFKQSAPVDLRLQQLKQEHLDSLVMALDVWAGGSENFNALLDARTFLHQKDGGQLPEHNQPGYTEMWQDELARRFGSTTFVPLEPGDNVQEGNYQIERQIAFGGLSAIYLARNKAYERIVLKEAVVPDGGNEELKEQSYNLLKREAEMLARLSHEQIARVFDHFIDNQRHYIVVEYLSGSDLRRLVKENGPQPQFMVVEWGLQMAQMLAYLHGQEEAILHRDFTPDNMILKTDGTIAIIDFGAANFFLGTATGTMIGKQAYIAPEQLRGKANPQSDLYALGGSLFFLLTGEDPEPLSVSQPALINRQIHPELDRLVSSLTQMDVEDRMQTAQHAIEALKEIKRVGKSDI
ncbi:MAG: serine/threonine-protein kinase [Candidatus Melainabacteria bacterium]|nr:serine/threonine-protein kinase [Candidatus Melainabacteria bacterium]